jgi:hypothetical protein
MPILGYPAHPEHDQAPPASVVFGVSGSAPELGPVSPDLLADFPADFVSRVEAGDWHLYALDFGANAVRALAMWIDNPNGEDFPLFVVNASFLTGDQTVRAGLRRLVDDALDPEVEHARYTRLPVVDVEALAAQRAERYVDMSDDALAMDYSGVSL